MTEQEYQDTLLKNAPPHNSPDFIDYLRDNNKVLYEGCCWLVIENAKYGHATAFENHSGASIEPLIERYGEYEWRVKPANKRSVQRFHIHILTN